MKNFFTFIMILSSLISFSQVGIDTDTPTETLDVNGTLRVRVADEISLSEFQNSDSILVVTSTGVVKRVFSGMVLKQSGAETPGNVAVLTDGTMLTGTGLTGSPITLGQQGATAGQVLIWDNISNSWKPGNTSALETLTTLTNNNNGSFTYKNEQGTLVTIKFISSDTDNLIATGTDGGSLIIANNLISGNTNNALIVGTDNKLYVSKQAADILYSNTTSGLAATNVQAAIDEIADLTATINMVNNNDGTFTFTKPDGSTVTIADTSISTLVNHGNGTFTYTNEDGVVTNFNANGTMVNNNNGTYTYTNAGGTATIINTNGLVVSGTQASGKTIATLTAGDGTVSNIKETITSIADNANGTFTYINEAGTATTITTGGVSVDDVVSGHKIATVNYADGTYDNLNETITGITNTVSGNKIATYTNESGTPADINETITNLSLSGSNLTLNNESTTDNVINMSTLPITGDVIGTLAASTVDKINGSPLGTTTGATSGQVLAWNGTTWSPASAAPATTSVSNTVTAPNALTTTVNGVTGTPVNMVTGVSNTSSANTLTTTVNGVTGSAVNIINSNTLAVSSGNLVSTINGVASNNLALTELDKQTIDVYNLNADGKNLDISLSNDGEATKQADLSALNIAGDVTGTLAASTVEAIQGVDIATTTPTLGQVLTYNGSLWTPSAVPTDVLTAYTDATTAPKHAIGTYKDELGNNTTVNETVTTLGINAGELVYVNENGSNANVGLISTDSGNSLIAGVDNKLYVDPTKITGDGSITSSDLTVTGGTNATLNPVTLTISDNAIINSKIADDAVKAENINADVAGTGLKQNTTTGALEVDPLTTTISGDVTGTLSNSKVEKIQNTPISSTSPTNKQVLTFNSGTGVWEPAVNPADALTTYTDQTTAPNRHKIGEYKDEIEGITNVNETLTNMTDTGNGKITYTNESGTIQVIEKSKLINNGNGTFTFTRNDGTDIVIGDDYATALYYDAPNRKIDLLNYNGDILNTITLSNMPLTVNGVAPASNGNISVLLSNVSVGIEADLPNPATTVPALVDGDIYIVTNDPNPLRDGVTYIYDDPTGWTLVNTDFSAADPRYVNIAGDTMTGDLNMGGTNTVTNLKTPVANSDAATKGYVDNFNAVDNLNGTFTITESNGTAVTISKAHLTDNGNGTYTFNNNNGANVTFSIAGGNITNTVTGNKIATYTNGAGAGGIDINETITSLDIQSGKIVFTNEDDSNAQISLISTTTPNSLSVGADGKLLVDVNASITKKDLTSGDSSITVTNGTGATLVDAGIKVSDAGITTTKIANDAVTAEKINSDIAGTGLKQNTTTGALEVDPTTITGDGTLSSPNSTITITGTPTNSILENVGLDVADGSITTAKLANNAVTNAKIAEDAVSAANINADVAGTGLKQNTITGALEVDPTTITGDSNITSTDLTVGGATNALLGNVTLAIADDAITTSKIANDAVTSAKIATDAISTTKIANDAVTAEKINSDVAGTGLKQNATTGALEIDAANSTIAGDVTGTLAASTVAKINGSPLGTTTGATSGQVLAWNGTTWSPASAAPATTTVSNTVTAPNALTTTVNGVTGTPVNMVTGVSNTSSANSLTTTVNGVTGSAVNMINSNTLAVSSGNLVSTINGVASNNLALTELDKQTIDVYNLNADGKNLDISLSNDGEATKQADLSALKIAGDVTGTLANSKVEKIQNVAVSPTAPTDKQVLTYNNTTSQWEAANAAASGWELTGNTGTSDASNFIGTTDTQDFVVKTNNTEAFRVTDTQNIGVGTGATTDASAKLQVNSTTQGMLAPRMTTAQINAISSPANGLLAYDTDRQCLMQNEGTALAPNWTCMSGNVVKWFYMPSITIDTSGATVGATKDLYALYQAQFNAPQVKSTGAPASLPFFSAANKLYYYVTYYDTSVFANVSIDANGILTYDVIGPAASCSYMNIVFMLK